MQAPPADQPLAAPEPILANDFGRFWRDTQADVMEAVRQVGERGWYILGQSVRDFEASLALACGRRHAVGCGNGLDALELGLRALGIAPGDQVLTSPLSAFATSLAIVRAGGVPVYADVDHSGLLRLDQAEDALAKDSKIRFVVPVHLYGHSLDLDHLARLRDRYGVKVLEDAAQAIGAGFAGRRLGDTSQAMALSFYPTKNLGALGDGGALLCDDDAVAATTRALRDYGQTGKYEHSQLGMNSRLDELHASILGVALLPRLARWTARRRTIADRYCSALSSELVKSLRCPPGSESVWHLYPVLVSANSRAAFMQYLRGKQIQTAVHYPKLITQQQALAGVPFRVLHEPTEATRICSCEVSLPIHPYLGDEEVGKVIDAVNAWQGS